MTKKNKKPADKVRIQKYLANIGVASRRKIEELLSEGAITVNGKIVIESPCFVNPEQDKITVDGRKIKHRREEKVYYLVNKPRGYICTSSDPDGRKKVIDIIPPSRERIYCVGRLDAESTGLVILTNDGNLTNRLTHPRYGVKKTYMVNISDRVDGEDTEKILEGLYLDGTKCKPDSIKIARRSNTSTLLEVVMSEGKNREIRRLFARLGYKVRRLRRVSIGPVTDRGLKTGNWRPLTIKEIKQLKKTGR